jgi:hypothetical protein
MEHVATTGLLATIHDEFSFSLSELHEDRYVTEFLCLPGLSA